MIGISQSILWVLTSSILDKERHYVILKGKINQSSLYIVAMYAPNKSQASFGDVIFEILQGCLEAQLLMLGDFNATFDKRLDRTSDSTTPGKFSQVYKRTRFG